MKQSLQQEAVEKTELKFQMLKIKFPEKEFASMQKKNLQQKNQEYLSFSSQPPPANKYINYNKYFSN